MINSEADALKYFHTAVRLLGMKASLATSTSIQFHLLVIKKKDFPADTASTWDRKDYERARENEDIFS